MAAWIDVIDENAMANGENLVVDIDGTDVAIFKVDDKFYALEDVCTHDGGEIASGTLEGDEIVCPRHGARFCIKTGEVKAPPAYENINCFPIRIEKGKVQVSDNRWD
ncbi:MAG: non-heme iron oxygenase ferredoxin subunit [Methylobacter sp.]|nr:non-heme iron oxygenase ferredoxin subunit [Methylobacter sp.]